MTLEEYEIWKKEQELKRLSKKKEERQRVSNVIIDYYLPGQHIKVEL